MSVNRYHESITNIELKQDHGNFPNVEQIVKKRKSRHHYQLIEACQKNPSFIKQ